MARLMEHILPSNGTRYERSLASMVERLLDLDVPLRQIWDPLTCPEEMLPFLAWTYSVDLWDNDWPLTKKRAVVASAPEDHRRKGTEDGIRRYIEMAGGNLKELLTPPTGFYMAEDLTKDQWESWINQMPRVRITLEHGHGEWDPGIGFMLDHATLDADFYRINDGPALYGRRAYLRSSKDGEETPLQLHTITDGIEEDQREAVEFERVIVPGMATNGVIFDDGILDVSYLDVQDISPKYFSFSLDRSYDYATSELALTAVPVGLEPQDTRYQRISETGEGGDRFFFGDFFGDRYFGVNDGGDLLADVLFLLDSAIASPVIDTISFMDISRFAMPAYHAEMLIDVPHRASQDAMFFDVSFVQEGSMLDDDQRHLDFVMNGISNSKALRDKISVTFQTTKERTLDEGYPLDGTAQLGDSVPNHL